jgi:protein FRA10AC1
MLNSYQVPFEYMEQEIRKNELVKCRVCINCARKLFYEKLKNMKKNSKKKKRKLRENGISSDDETFSTHDEIIEVLFNENSGDNDILNIDIKNDIGGI